MECLTDFADQAVILPLVGAIAGMLVLEGWQRGALAWTLGFAGTSLAVLVTKVACLAFAPMLATWNVQSPSGHTAGAALVCGGFAWMLVRRRSAVVLAAACGACVIGLTRLALAKHTAVEVCIGAVVGTAGAVILARTAGRPPQLRAWRLAGVVVAVLIAFHGLHLPAEAAIRNLTEKMVSAVREIET